MNLSPFTRSILRFRWQAIAGTVLIAFIVTGCYKNQVLNQRYITRSYLQSNCADPWGVGYNTPDYLTRKNVTEYLSKFGIYVVGVVIRPLDAPAPCTDCHCKTGMGIYVTTTDDDSAKARIGRAGFQ